MNHINKLISQDDLVWADKCCDYIPVVSGITNVYGIWAKRELLSKMEPEELEKNHYYVHLQNKSYMRNVACIVFGFFVPVVGAPLLLIPIDLVKKAAASVLAGHSDRCLNKSSYKPLSENSLRVRAGYRYAKGCRTLAALMGDPQAMLAKARKREAAGKTRGAFEMYNALSSQGNAEARKALAHCFDQGVGTKVDKVYALRLYKQADKLGAKSCQEHIDRLSHSVKRTGRFEKIIGTVTSRINRKVQIL